ncbi:hypothetical protein ACFSQW_20110 [Sphingobacterium tabacisoli]|uniref:Uncharacterized protein n=1 Tax=Sphingobacterium tabacisoli TaxID=2044855 RepID=A0ABW5L7G3_9SPHI
MKALNRNYFLLSIGLFIINLLVCTNIAEQSVISKELISTDREEFETICEKILTYFDDSKGCFFLDPDILKQGITPNLEHRMRTDICTDPVIGKKC